MINILVLEDDAVLNKSVCTYLNDSGFSAKGFLNANDAYDAMVWNNMTVGLALGIPGLLMLCLAWPVYKAVTGSRRKKYAQQVMELSGAIIKEDAK